MGVESAKWRSRTLGSKETHWTPLPGEAHTKGGSSAAFFYSPPPGA